MYSTSKRLYRREDLTEAFKDKCLFLQYNKGINTFYFRCSDFNAGRCRWKGLIQWFCWVLSLKILVLMSNSTKIDHTWPLFTNTDMFGLFLKPKTRRCRPYTVVSCCTIWCFEAILQLLLDQMKNPQNMFNCGGIFQYESHNADPNEGRGET